MLPDNIIISAWTYRHANALTNNEGWGFTALQMTQDKYIHKMAYGRKYDRTDMSFVFVFLFWGFFWMFFSENSVDCVKDTVFTLFKR